MVWRGRRQGAETKFLFLGRRRSRGEELLIFKGGVREKVKERLELRINLDAVIVLLEKSRALNHILFLTNKSIKSTSIAKLKQI